MTKPISTFYATHRGYEIRHRPWRKQHPWYAQVPNADGRTLWCDVASPQVAQALIDRSLLLMELEQNV